jgi:hypothetical protein
MPSARPILSIQIGLAGILPLAEGITPPRPHPLVFAALDDAHHSMGWRTAFAHRAPSQSWARAGVRGSWRAKKTPPGRAGGVVVGFLANSPRPWGRGVVRSS